MHSFRFTYDIHGVARVASSAALPDLEYFAASIEQADVAVSVARGGVPRPLLEESAQRGTSVTVSPGIARAPHMLFTSVVEPVLAPLAR